MKKNRIPQSIIPTDDDRAKFKKKCKAALRDIEDEYGISFEFGRIDERYTNEARMRVWFKKVKEPTLWDTPAAIALVKAMKADRKPLNNSVAVEPVIDPDTFQPRIAVLLNNQPWFSVGLELVVDVKQSPRALGGDALTNDQVAATLIEMYQNEFPQLKDEVVEAFRLMTERAKANKNS